MAHSLSSLPDELCCSICIEIFKEPVILKCNHSFCGSCLQDCWKNKSSRECPECKQKCSKDEPILNQRLKEVADLFLQKNDQSEIQNESFCSLHVEKFLSFCEEDQDVICLVCVNSIKHRDHHHSPVEKALQNKKEELKAVLNPIKEHVKKLTEARKEYDETISHIKIQARDTEKQIKEEYERIYQFLRDEERSRLIALRKEEEENTRRVMEMMDNISKHISTLSGKIESTERRLMRDDITFLKTYKDTKERLDFKLQDPELLSGVPIDANKHLEPQKLRGNKIMEHILSLPDLTTALNTGDEPQPSDNTETPGHLGFVLASEGFTSGKHSWEVEVGDSPSWAVGVLEEPINKKRKITFRPDSGFWALMLKNGEYKAGYTRLEVKKKPEKIRVELDYDNRQVSFFNSTDKSCIISLENKCSEKLFPFVCPWITGTEQNHEGLQISILKVKFLTEKISSFFSIPGPKLPSINTTSKPAPGQNIFNFSSINTVPKPTPPIKVHIAVSGPALNLHQTFMKKLHMSLEECSLENCSVILVFCPVVTRMGTDMDAGVKNVPDDKPVILVLMHHSYNPDHVDDIPITPPRSNMVKVVQCVFHETVGLLECELNERTVRAVRAELQQFQTNTVVAGDVGVLSLPDLTTALNTGDEQQPSDNTETPGHLGFVLASEGFTSGKHSWEVEVGDSPSWAVGVLEEPINKERKITFRPDSGFWALMLKNGEYQAGYSRLEVKKKPEKIGVELDYDNRQVSFFNSTDKSCIISLENKCSEKLFPFVCPWITGTEQNHEGLQISILKVKFLTEKIWSFLNIPWPKWPSINTTSKPAPVKVHIAVSGPALNSHQTFMKKLDMSLEECSLENCSVILIFCPVVTRMGTDMDAGVKNVPDDKPVILVIMHHSYNPDYTDDIPITAPRSNVVKVVQCVFHETVGLLECELNERTVRAVRAELQQFQTNTVVAGDVGGLSLPDLTTALNTGDKQQPSDNTETPGHLGFVLASEGFTSGKHSWEVEVGDSPSWAVGVLEEPINKERKITFRPDSGFWALMLKNGEYQAGYSRLEVKKKPEKIGVELDYDNRQVSFFNSTDKSCIISLENKCSEKLFPFVCPWITGTEQNHEGLQISILKVKFLTEKIWSFFSIPWPKLPSINTTSKPAPVKVHIAVSGPALNSHQTFMKKLDMSLEECSLENCSVILVFCPVVTQMWTDMDTGVKNVPDDKPIILVLLHYSYNPDHIDDIPITPPRSNVVKVVQCVFHETVGLLECELNERAVRAVRAELKRLQTASVVARHVGGTLAPPPSQTHP
ncbi:uncharacterized protein LOC108925171 isoform X3 [Scleropages formosus]|uniref:uncharacterized protein LOC108925171 isoform X3 n=1 Tax=Scleropages formosus TaxID=113540 RepID=UPI0010FA8709|nr:uncharacterized protein LOC108925171 isoform X3 [Scleropages formosus]